MKKLMGVLAVLTILVAFGCGGPRLKAPTMVGGGSYSIAVLSDRGITPELGPDRSNQYNQVGEWMEQDLLRTLKKAGYNARLVNSRREFAGGPGEYLLTVRIERYNPGSKAARMLVGFGAGATSLDTHYELYSAKSQPLLAEDHGVGSSIDWYQVVQKLNQQMVDAVSRKLAEGGARG
ncbi:DUF4410 domain-containing protein [Trichloromonas sp.]|uniref:DUF4410 domain-containing protein n=1 Tax=Trichloromonas sp. TaxID=3069249 RepID=UPI003D81AA3C